MKKELIAVLLSLLIGPAHAAAYWIDGSYLNQKSFGVNRTNNPKISDAEKNNLQFHTGYVLGAVDVLSGMGLICPQSKITAEQFNAIVIKYIKANPEKWTEPGGELVLWALRPAFPCSK